ncbi:MAG: hypothetical protein JJU02_12700 [Cryomorphaceae bacterium]|nr:hypothetical protein [Cryomorphaceae bacterium]
MLKSKIHLSVLGVLLFVNSAFSHPFYVSLLEMHYNENSNRWECAMRIFTDDLELGISNSLKTPGVSLEGKEAQNDSLVWVFVQKHFEIPGSKMTWIGREGDPDAQWIYFEVSAPEAQLVELRWDGLARWLPGQKNVLHIHRDRKLIRTYLYDAKKSIQTVDLGG